MLLVWGAGLAVGVGLIWMFASTLHAKSSQPPGPHRVGSPVLVPAAEQISSPLLDTNGEDDRDKKGDDGEDAQKTDEQLLIEKGGRLFFTETFNGNGRTCGTCHRAENNFTIDPAFIATLPPDDPLFVAEFNPDLAENFEKPKLMREFGLILGNADGFDDLEKKFVMRGVPHLLGLRTSVDSSDGPRTGWAGDDGSLRSFAIGAIRQHLTKTLNRVAGVDFREPTEEELDALEAFMLSLGRQEDLEFLLPLRGAVAKKGQSIFINEGKCMACHSDAGANVQLVKRSSFNGNQNFNTGVEALPDQPGRLEGPVPPPDGGFGPGDPSCNPPCGDGTFNIQSLVEAADTGPFFHNNAIRTIEGAVAFYNTDAFNTSPGAVIVGGIDLEATQVEAVAAFLRVINALENIRVSIELLEDIRSPNGRTMVPIERALYETEDAIEVLQGAGLHPEAVTILEEAARLMGTTKVGEAIEELAKAKGLLVEVP